MPREYYTLEENPAYTEEIEKLYNSDPVLAESGVFYNLLLRIMNNIRAVKKEADELEKTKGDVTAGGDNTFTGTNTFKKKVIVPAPTDDTHAANKAYVDNKITNMKAEAAKAYLKNNGGTFSGTYTSTENSTSILLRNTTSVVNSVFTQINSTGVIVYNQPAGAKTQLLADTIPTLNLSTNNINGFLTFDSNSDFSLKTSNASSGPLANLNVAAPKSNNHAINKKYLDDYFVGVKASNSQKYTITSNKLYFYPCLNMVSGSCQLNLSENISTFDIRFNGSVVNATSKPFTIYTSSHVPRLFHGYCFKSPSKDDNILSFYMDDAIGPKNASVWHIIISV